MLTEGSKQMESKVSDLLVLTTSLCVDTGDVGCSAPFIFFDAMFVGVSFWLCVRPCARVRSGFFGHDVLRW